MNSVCKARRVELPFASTSEIFVSSKKSPVGGLSKQVFDRIFSAIALLACAPLFLAIAVVLKILSPGPVFFRHERVGFGGKSFYCLKFRTMVVDSNERLRAHLAACPEAREEFKAQRKLRKDPRIVPGIGNFLRRTSLDEMPQLLNVLCNEMSIVGPRPVTSEETVLYGASKGDYMSVRPGITGLWQVSGRNSLTFDQRIKIDTRYVRKWTFFGDLGIILRTVRVLWIGEGVY